MSRLALAAALTMAVAGCKSTPTAPPRASLGGELKHQDEQLVGQRFRTLLDFENDSDAVFAKADGEGHRITAGHTGGGGFSAANGVTFKIDPLLYGAPLAAEWTLLGAYVRPQDGGPVSAELLLDGKPVARYTRDVPAGTWAFVGIDLAEPKLATMLDSVRGTVQHITLHVSAAQADYDDVLLVNNTRTLVDDSAAGGWTITRKGGAIDVTSTAKASHVRIPLAGAAEGGWAVDEISARRLCLHQEGKFLTLLPDGRSIGDGVTQPPPEIATIDIADECGRIDRDTDGDTNNDGYNERRGSYELDAAGPRMTFKISPGKAPAQAPLIEIGKLPPGNLTVMAEGKLIDTVCRLPDGRVLVLLPITIDRPTEVTLKTSDNP